MKLKHYLSIFAIAAVVASCTKEGPAGPQGENGLNGAANLYVSNYTIYPSNWTQSNSSTYFVATTTSIPVGDVVNVYVSLNGNAYTPLATSGFFATGDNLTFVYGNGGDVTLWDYFNNAGGPGVTIYVEVADIPPALNVKYPNVNWKNYNEVSALPEFQAALAKVK